MLEKFNKIISSYIIENEIESMDDFIFICKIINIFNSYPHEYKSINYQRNVSIEDSYNYALEFFKIINPSYATYLKENKDCIRYIKDDSLKNSYCDIIDNKKIILIATKETIEDSYDITHEVIHSMTIEGEISYARNIFCEVLTYLTEELQYEYYLRGEIIDECEFNSKKNLQTAYLATELLEYELNFIKVYLDHGIITMEDLNNLYDESKNKNLFCDHLKDILELNELRILDYYRIIIGIIFAYYMLDKIHQNEMSLKDFFELNENINKYEIEDFINYINLKCTDDYIFDLDKESYDKLEESFVKTLKSRCDNDRGRLQKIK